jgi:hypothetical protein
VSGQQARALAWGLGVKLEVRHQHHNGQFEQQNEAGEQFVGDNAAAHADQRLTRTSEYRVGLFQLSVSTSQGEGEHNVKKVEI